MELIGLSSVLKLPFSYPEQYPNSSLLTDLISSKKCVFTITAEILALSLANFLSSISGEIHELMIYAMCQRTRAVNLTICYRKKQIDVNF